MKEYFEEGLIPGPIFDWSNIVFFGIRNWLENSLCKLSLRPCLLNKKLTLKKIKKEINDWYRKVKKIALKSEKLYFVVIFLFK